MSNVEQSDVSYHERESGEPTPEVIEKETEIIKHEIKDANGEVVCTTEVETRNNPDYPEGQEVLRYELVSPSGERVNLLEKAGMTNEVVLQKRGDNYYCQRGKDNAPQVLLIPPAESTIDIATALHEMGHAAQNRDPEFANIASGVDDFLLREDMDIVERWLAMGWQLNKQQREIKLNTSDAETVHRLDILDNELFRINANLEKVSKAKEEAFKKAEHFQGFIQDGVREGNPDKQVFFYELLRQELMAVGELNEQSSTLQHRKAEIYRDVVQLVDQHGPALKEAAQIGTKIRERNATARAFIWMRGIKQTHNIDLFAQQDQAEAVAKVGGIRKFAERKGMRVEEYPLLSDCSTDSVNAYDDLKLALGTYQAERSANYRKSQDWADARNARNEAAQLASQVAASESSS